MPLQVHDESDGVVAVEMGGRLSGEDYDQVAPRLEQMIEHRGRLRLLCDMHNFHGWRHKALWKDAKFSLKHRKDLDKVALVGERRWQHWVGRMCDWFTPAEVRYFDHNHLDDARIWVRA